MTMQMRRNFASNVVKARAIPAERKYAMKHVSADLFKIIGLKETSYRTALIKTWEYINANGLKVFVVILIYSVGY